FLDAGAVQVGHDHAGALAGEQERGRPADAGAATGNQRNLADKLPGHALPASHRIDFGAFCPLGIRVVYSRPFIRSWKSALASLMAWGSWSRSMVVSASTLAATIMPLWPIGEPMAATFCQLWPGLPAAKQAVSRPPVGMCQLMSPTSVEPPSTYGF